MNHMKCQKIKKYRVEEEFIMKKLHVFSLILVLTMSVGLFAGCGSKEEAPDQTAPQQNTQSSDESKEEALEGTVTMS